MELTSQQVRDWMNDPVTQEILSRMRIVEQDATEMLIQGVDNYHYGRGLIAGLRMIHQLQGDELDGNK